MHGKKKQVKKKQEVDLGLLKNDNDERPWEKTEEFEDLYEGLLNCYLQYKEMANRRKLELHPRRGPGAGARLVGGDDNKQPEEQDFKDFYLPPNIPQLDKPDQQKIWIKEYIDEVGERPQPDPITLMADTLHLEALETVKDRSNPTETRKELAAYFRRHAVYLQHKKHKMLGRWATQVTSSYQVDSKSEHFERMLGRLQQEHDSALNRVERLEIDDCYDQAVDPNVKRPQPISREKEAPKDGCATTTLLYVEAKGQSVNSSIRMDDVEVYLRTITYRQQLTRLAEKLAIGVKWLPYTSRFNIWEQSRRSVQLDKNARARDISNLFKKVELEAENRLHKLGIQEETLKKIVLRKYTFHLRQEEYARHDQRLLNSYKQNHERPPFLFTSNIELRESLVPMAKESNLGLGTFLEQDGGGQAAYQVDTQFPPEFQKQSLRMQFDWIDSGEGTSADTDLLLITKLCEELKIDKNEMYAEMAKQAETERKKSILGQIGKDAGNGQVGDSNGQGGKQANDYKTGDPGEDIARENLIRRIKEMRFFSLDATDKVLKDADWLRYVCWQPVVPEVIARQNQHLSSHEENPIDSLLQSAFEFVDVNEASAAIKILEESARAHSQKVKSYFRELSSKTPSVSLPSPDDMLEGTLKEATLGDGASQEGAGKDNDIAHYGDQSILSYLERIDPLRPELVKSYYKLRLLKKRKLKERLLQALNYFRAVQKRLAFDVREFYTRERALGGRDYEESLIGPQYGYDSHGNLRAKMCTQSGPGHINVTRLHRELDTESHQFDLATDGKTLKEDVVSIKGYKYNKQFNPRLTSTCPCVPKFHSTFGRPTLYEDLSQEIEKQGLPGQKLQFVASPKKASLDRIIFKQGSKNLFDSEIQVLDEHGIEVVYREALNDLVLLEEEMMKIGSYYLNKAELDKHLGAREQPSTMLDRAEIALHLFEGELEVQLRKIIIVEELLVAYEHVCDPLEAVRLLQVIVDTMATRPRLNLEATYFRDSYVCEVDVLKEKHMLFRELLHFQKDLEKQKNREVRAFQELKMRKVQEHSLSSKWQYRRDAKRIERVGTTEEALHGTDEEKATIAKKERQQREYLEQQQALREIAERHITEFAGDQHTDFAQVLGLPEVTAADLLRKQGQQDPIVVDAMREHCTFSKQIEGYPWFFKGSEESSAALGYHTEDMGATDFFDSLCVVTRLHAAIEQASKELHFTFRPENGQYSASMDRAMLIEARGILTNLRRHRDEGTSMVIKQARIKSAQQIEQDFYLASPDKLMFLMREFKADMNPDNIQVTGNPLLVSKLDISEVAKFDFPRLKTADIEGDDELNDAQLLERAVDLAKISFTRQRKAQENLKRLQEEFGGQSDDDENDERKIQSPSMMIMSCNIVEVIRLRHELCKLIYECEILGETHLTQLEAANKAERLVGAASNSFDTRQISRENSNFVDVNDGSKIEADLAFMEFDATLRASLDFKSECCIKALMTNLGVEELRAVVRYQLLQKQLLTVAVQRNQALMDGPEQGLRELEMLDPPARREDTCVVPGAMVNLDSIFSGAVDGPNREKRKGEYTRFSTNITQQVNHAFLAISPIKTRHKASANRKWTQFQQKVCQTERNVETQLRILRSFRLRILHEFCIDASKELYGESISLQTLMTCKELRRRAQLFPRELSLFKHGDMAIVEHLAYRLAKNYEDDTHFGPDRPTLQNYLKGEPKETLLFIPSSSEIMAHAAACKEEAPGPSYTNLAEHIKEEHIDSHVLELSQGATMITVGPQGLNANSKRIVNFKEAISFSSSQTEVLMFSTYLLQILSLEYLMGRNNAKGTQVLELEDNIFAGNQFWVKSLARDLPTDPAHDKLQGVSNRVISKIMTQKRQRIDLAEDLSQISRRLFAMNEFVNGPAANHDSKKMSGVLELLRMQHQASFLQLLNGVDSAIDLYLEQRNEENFSKVMAAQALLARQDHGINLLGNGHYLNQGVRSALYLDPALPILTDHDEFQKGYTPIQDEHAMVPRQVALVRRLYGKHGHISSKARPGILSQSVPYYSHLNGLFFNMCDNERQFLASNFYQLDEGLREYLIFNKLVQDKNAKPTTSTEENDGTKQEPEIFVERPKDILQAKIAYLALKVDARQLQRVLMSWTIEAALPDDVEGYLEAQRLVRERTILKVLKRRDDLIYDYYQSQKKRTAADEGTTVGGLGKQAKQLKRQVLESVNQSTREHGVVATTAHLRAEIHVAARVLEVEMLKMSWQIIDNEQRALLASFDQAAAHGAVHKLVRPGQQFASTPFQQVDEDAHLDVVTKLGFVQTFLTKLRNRCTEVETLASGPGIVFSLKDFNECLQNFCQNLIKHGETALRTRVETQHIRLNQYQHLLYMKEKQALYYRKKCEQFLGDIDKLVAAKISQKGSQLIYELDVASRELRVLRDNYRLMQGLMMGELRHEYCRAIEEKQERIEQLLLAYKDHGERLKSSTYADFVDDFMFVAAAVKEAADPDQDPDKAKTAKKVYEAAAEARNNPKLLKAGEAPRTENELRNEWQAYLQNEPDPIGKKQRPIRTAEHAREVAELKLKLQKTAFFYKLKMGVIGEQKESELAAMNKQVTSNAALWDQLAEAEKREQITKQELNATKMSLASYEKLIEKLQGQLENLNAQKARLQAYKNSRSKRVDELENKMKDLEILENIDLNKILTELKSRDNQIETFKNEQRTGQGKYLEAVQQKANREVLDLREKLAQERELKLQAYDRLEGLRVEMRALEGKDLKSDLWKDKCRELFEMCKDLQTENEDLKSIVNDANRANLLRQQDEAASAHTMRSNALGARVPASVKSQPHVRGADRLFTSRTAGHNAPASNAARPAKQPYGGRLASGTGIGGHSLSKGAFQAAHATHGAPGVFQLPAEFDGFSGMTGSGKPAGAGSAYYKDTTVHSENMRSQQLTAVPMMGAAGGHVFGGGFNEGEILSLSNMPMGDSLAARDSYPGASLALPGANLGQRNVMTAGTGTRPMRAGVRRNFAARDNGGLQAAATGSLPTRDGGLRRMQNSLDPSRSGLMSGTTGKSAQRGGSRVNPLSGRTTAGQHGTVEPPSAQYLGLGVHGRQAGAPGLTPSNVGSSSALQRAGLQSVPGQQPVNVNINFNTTNISLNK